MSKELKKILVTGGAGFIGSNLCEKLLASGYKVVCLDNFLTGSKDNISNLFASDKFEFLQQDVTEPISIEVDFIFHLACPASPVHYQRNPIQTLRTNILGTIHMLNLARQNEIPMIHASTSEVYGDPQVHPQPEGYWGHVNPIGLRACYDEGKRCAETLCIDTHRQFGTDVRIVRIFNTYGPRMSPDDGRVISNFIVQSLQGKPLTIYGDGNQTRSFQYVEDLLQGLMALFKSKNFLGPVNLGNPEEYPIKNIAEFVLAETASKSTMEYRPLPADDPKKRRPDITLAKEKLDWSPKVGVKEGLRKTIAYFKNKLGCCNRL